MRVNNSAGLEGVRTMERLGLEECTSKNVPLSGSNVTRFHSVCGKKRSGAQCRRYI